MTATPKTPKNAGPARRRGFKPYLQSELPEPPVNSGLAGGGEIGLLRRGGSLHFCDETGLGQSLLASQLAIAAALRSHPRNLNSCDDTRGAVTTKRADIS